YVAAWSSEKTLPELKESLEIIRSTSSGLIEEIQANYTEIIKENLQDKTEAKQMAEQPQKRASIKDKLVANREVIKQKEKPKLLNAVEKSGREGNIR
ncbi:MAG: hypothetical protein K2K90_13375, partial [Lachnospiraceae bacterium]|nr:hypothetical protein [Lachnospiraceae bacterium]